MKRILSVLAMILWAASAQAATWYVDNSTGASGDGRSWTTAWKNISDIKGLRPGDVVNISGGTESQTYYTGEFLSASGTQGNRITYQVSTEPGHNGMVNIVVPNQAPWHWIYASPSKGIGQWITINGKVNGVSHMTVDAPIFLEGDESQGITLRYITTAARVRAYDSDTIELDHMTFTLRNGIDGVILGIGRGQGAVYIYPTGYTRNLIHDSVFYLAGDAGGSGNGDDGIQNVGNISIYNNRFIGVNVSPYNGHQHQDGIQTRGPRVSIYNNYFENIWNYPVYGDIRNAQEPESFQVFNNIFYNNPSANIAIGCGGIASNIDDITVFNNTIINAGIGVSVGKGEEGCTVTNAYVVNNLFYNVHTTVHNHPSVTTSNNTDGTSTNITFVNPVSDFHLQAGSTAAISQGISPSYINSITTRDRDGKVRPLGSTWTIGAFEFGSTTGIVAPPPPQKVIITN